VSTLRYSGSIRIRVTYLEPWLAGTKPPAGRSTMTHGEYRCFLRAGEHTVTVHVGARVRYAGDAVDSPEAFDDAARAAIAFAADEHAEWGDHAATDPDGNVCIFRSRHTPFGRSSSHAWPKEKVVS
jgi:hypothetical protein